MQEDTQDLSARIRILEERLRMQEDIQEIHKLKALYCYYDDGGWPEHGATHMGPFAELFVEDSVFDGRPYLPLCEGRDEIRKMQHGLRVVPFLFHNVTNALIEVDGDMARGEWHVVSFSARPDGTSARHLGTYDEQYVRTALGWRYKSVKVTVVREIAVTGGHVERPV
jgi:hypothetical protein